MITWSLLTYQTKVVTEYNPSLRDYQRLYALHPTTLACPCRTTTMPYKHFIVAKVDIHQICSSDFVQDKWIDAFYFADSSRYGSIDFRTTANSQVKKTYFSMDFYSKTVRSSLNYYKVYVR